ncbi:MAG TPA: LuxR C-terminal-related transcriptional regulator [Chitinophagaceae bacterium]|nr:LuxR C-terminal-related transcriptional regulator [Chitinophagaceae bacterium]
MQLSMACSDCQKKMQSKHYTYAQYLNLMADSSGIKMQEESNLIIDRFSASQNIPSRFGPTTFLVDFATKKYYYVHESCFSIFGYSNTWFKESGLNGFLKKWHPADYNIINEKIFPDNMQFLKTISKEKVADIVFSYNYRVLNPKGEYVNTLQRFSYIPDENTGIPAGMVGVAFDITHFKNDLSIVHTIEETSWHNNEIVNTIVLKKVHPVLEFEELSLVTNREKEILNHMAAGMSSKQIAHKLEISINTINNHRKNMLAKTNCKTSAELTKYAVKHGLLPTFLLCIQLIPY